MKPSDHDEEREKRLGEERAKWYFHRCLDEILKNRRMSEDEKQAALVACITGGRWYVWNRNMNREAREQATHRDRGGLTCQILCGWNPEDRIAVGWDRKLETYFAQVWKERTKNGENRYDVYYRCGMKPGEITTVDVLGAAMGGHINIPEVVLDELRDPIRVSPIRAPKPIRAEDHPEAVSAHPSREAQAHLPDGVFEPRRQAVIRTPESSGRATAAPTRRDPDDWLKIEPRRPDRSARREEAREACEHDLRPLQAYHPKLTREL